MFRALHRTLLAQLVTRATTDTRDRRIRNTNEIRERYPAQDRCCIVEGIRRGATSVYRRSTFPHLLPFTRAFFTRRRRRRRGEEEEEESAISAAGETTSPHQICGRMVMEAFNLGNII